MREYMREYRRRNSSREAARDAAKRATPEWKAYIRAFKQRPEQRVRIAESSRRYRAANRVRARETQRRWRERNHDHYNALASARRQQTPSWANRKAILAIYKAAAKLRAHTGLPYEVDHKIPLRGKIVSGLHVETNLQIIERRANRAKHNRFLD